MKKEFTYLFGAGASANVLPTVKTLGNELKEFSKFINNTTALNNSDKIRQITSQIEIDLKWLIKEEGKHASIDTFAKKLYLTDQFPKLKVLKGLIDAFFTIRQSINETDKRYDAFLASLITGTNASNIRLPENINILSWNYDFQFELSLITFFMTRKIEELESRCKLIPNGQGNFDIIEEFCLVKLNGTAGGLIVDEKSFSRKNFIDILPEDNIEENADEIFKKHISIYEDVIKNYNSTIEDEKSISSIMFAWEKNEVSNQIRSYTNKKIQETSILTVIGYSFPTFNREIDKAILKSMLQLEKIIIQAPIEDIDSIKFRITSLLDPAMREVTIEKFPSKDEFFIPFEFN